MSLLAQRSVALAVAQHSYVGQSGELVIQKNKIFTVLGDLFSKGDKGFSKHMVFPNDPVFP